MTKKCEDRLSEDLKKVDFEWLEKFKAKVDEEWERRLKENYVEVTKLICSRDKVMGVRALDRLTEQEIDVRARLVLNAAGP